VSGPAHDLSKLRINRDPPPEVSRAFGRTLLIIAVLVVLVLAAVFFARGRSVAIVDAIVVESRVSGGGSAAAGATAVTANGYVVARTRASVSAKIPGRLASLPVDGGSVVTRGEVIARLDNDDYQAAVAEQKGNLAGAEAQLIEAEADRDQAAREFARVQEMRASNPNLISAQDEEVSQNRVTTTTARASAARARLQSARAALQFAEANLENTYIRAPFSGTVLRKEAEVGEVVAPSVGGGLTRGAVVTMADLNTLEVEVDVNEAYIGRVHRDQVARITLDAYPDTAFRGRVRQVVPTADRQRATVQVKVSILDKDPRILPEMGARVDFVAASPDTAVSGAAPAADAAPRFRLPVAAVRESSGGTIVWIIRGGKLESRSVDAGPASAGYREIRRGLSGGELVLVGGVTQPEQGMRVEVGGK
jgi:RND family efflux transporter MFP subunit